MKKLIATLATAFLSSFLFAQSPGGVNTGIRAWYRADHPANTFSSWAEQYTANAAIPGIVSHQAPILNTTAGSNLLNFNRSYSFTTGSYFVIPDALNIGGSSASSYSVFGVAKMHGTNNNRIFSSYSECINNSFLMGYYWGVEGALHIWGTPSYVSPGSNGVSSVTANLNLFSLTRTGGTTATTLRKNGTQISSSATSSNTGIRLQINGQTRGFNPSCNSWIFEESSDCTVGELITYTTDNLTGTGIVQIESYLALKYGLMKPGHYLNSWGVWIWTSGLGYDNHVIGIVRDDISLLHQRISKSQASIPDIITLSTDNNFINPNEAGAGGHTNISNNGFYFLTGNNGASTTYAGKSGLNNGLNAVMNRVWKVQSSNTAQNLFIKVNDIKATHLIYSSDPTFSTGVNYAALTAGVTSGIQIPDGNYFTFACNIKSPGGVVTGLKAWYRADHAANTAIRWSEQDTQFVANAAVATGTPVLNSTGNNLINFNASYTLTTGQYFSVPANLNVGGTNASSYNILGIARLAGTNNGRVFATVVDHFLMGYYSNTEGSLFIRGVPGYLTPGFNGVTASTTNLNLFSLTRTGGTSATTFRKNGTQISTSNYSDNMAVQLQINGVNGNNETSDCTVAEFITYTADNLNGTNLTKIESYLAIKYGINKTGAYIRTNGDTVWTSGGGYDNNIIGLAREDSTLLHQRISTSQAAVPDIITLSTDNNFANPNKAGAGGHTNISNDGFYFVTGNNGASTTHYVTKNRLSNGINAVLARIWKVQQTGTAQNVFIKTTDSKVTYLIHSTDPTFTTGVNYVLLTAGATGGIQIPTGSYFTFGINIKTPGGVVTGLNAWYRADNAANTATSWAEQMSANSAAATGTPVLNTSGSNLINFNASYSFTSGQYFVVPPALNVGGSSTSSYNIIGVGKLTGASKNRVFSSFAGNFLMGYWNNTEGSLFINGGPSYLNAGSFGITTATSNLNLFSLTRTGGSTATTLRKNGTQLSSSSASDNMAVQLQINGVNGNSETSDCAVAEVITYTSDNLSDAWLPQIESYLAIKYGINKNGSYIRSNGDTVWTSGGGFDNNVIGVVRDDNTLLHQRISTSQSATPDIITISMDNNFTNPNKTGTGGHADIDNNNFYFITGNNGASTSYTVKNGLSFPLNAVMNRVWKVQQGGTAQNIFIRTTDQKATHLIYSTDPAFATGVNYVMLTSGATNGLQIPANHYFTFATILRAPGGVLPGLNAWYRADNPVNTATMWAGQTNSYSATATGLPVLNTTGSDLMNFNASYTMQLARYFTVPANLNVGGSSASAYSILGVAKLKSTSNNRVFGSRVGNFLMGYYSNTEGSLSINGSPSFLTVGSDGVTDAFNNLNLFSLTRTGTSTATTFRKNGTQLSTSPTSDNMAIQLQINGGNGNNETSICIVGEVITYTTDNLSGNSMQKIESYLSLKYGINKPGDYLNSSGTKVWNAGTGYDHNVIGIVRDDSTLLHQRISTSQSGVPDVIILSTDQNFINMNTSGTGGHTDIGSNNYSFITGNDGASATYVAKSGLANGLNFIMKRVWRVQQSGTAQGLFIKTTDSKATYLIYSTDPAFSSGVNYAFLTSGVTQGIQIPDGSYFTFASVNAAASYAPGGVFTGLNAWYRADHPGNTATRMVEQNTFNISNDAIAYGTLTLNTGSSLTNFNPNYRFFTGTYFTTSPALKFGGSSASSYSLFGVGNVTNNDDQRVFGAANGNFLMGYWNNTEGSLHINGTPSYITPGANGVMNSTADLNLFSLTRTGGSTATTLRKNGTQLSTSSASDNMAIQVQINGSGGNNETSDCIVNELISYTTDNLSGTQLAQIETYLALKYGITMGSSTNPVHYYNSDGSIIWSGNTNYQNNIAGIAYDSISLLNQKISESSSQMINPQVTVALGAYTGSLPSRNANNINTFSKNKSSLIWGDNGNMTPMSNTPGSYTNFTYNGVNTERRMNRVWRVQANNFNQPVTIRFFMNAVGATTLPNETSGCANYVIVFADDAAFTTNVTVSNAAVIGAFYQATCTFPSGTSYFTFAKVSEIAPGRISLPSASTAFNTTSNCKTAGWQYYYYDVAKTRKAYAIDWNGNTPHASQNGVLTYSATPFSTYSGGFRCNIMGRLMELLPGGGTFTANGGVKVRIYFDSTELNNHLVSLPVNRGWFKYPGDAAAAIAANNGQSIIGAVTINPSSGGQEDGIDYVQFDGIQSFSTFGYSSNTFQVVLPIQLIYFNARLANDCQTEISWESDYEEGQLKYIVEYSTDGRLFIPIAEKQGMGDKSVYNIKYSAPGKAYYQLKMVQSDGVSTYSAIAMVNGCSNKLHTVLYPNPAENDAILDNLGQGIKTILVYDANGKQIAGYVTGNARQILPAGDFAKGVYIIKVIGQNNTEVFKLIKQ